ncbi:elongation of very long chain fatty acids protein 6-like [Bombus vosnesenskii]|uniref:Elongation of very long chain fatty acids protein n=1 Tax=Bombus vosnesenskii TaxID=207650 RepID=A0A6J3KU72_9HYME|nr:elongation of very long chain fatty acids protein 6-like [Bombus vosnesenskii]XP_050491924.1 elongation of very long chain fatty acids protein 6-like [Bombus huntii]
MNEVNYFMNVTGPEHWIIFDFETTDFIWNVLIWMRNYWWKCFYYTAIYLVVIFTGKLYMSNRPKFDLRSALALWSGLLAIFSIIGTIRTMPELFHILYNHGFYYSICSNSYYTHDHVCAFWSSLFALSKIVELGDTVFIVLRKQPLIFLHWYHHITVIYFTWYSYALLMGTSRWYIVMNYFVHSWMYSYYALKAMEIKPPRFIAMMITTMQLVQMVVGFFVTGAAYYYIKIGEKECHATTFNAACGLLMYFSYFVLFAMYFYKTYLSGNSRTKVE